jgi:hypothetical protein
VAPPSLPACAPIWQLFLLPFSPSAPPAAMRTSLLSLLSALLLLLLLQLPCSLCDDSQGLVLKKREPPAGFDPYAALHVARSAGKEEIRRAYKRGLNIMGRAAAKGGHGQAASAQDAATMEDIALVRGGKSSAHARTRAHTHARAGSLCQPHSLAISRLLSLFSLRSSLLCPLPPCRHMSCSLMQSGRPSLTQSTQLQRCPPQCPPGTRRATCEVLNCEREREREEESATTQQPQLWTACQALLGHS